MVGIALGDGNLSNPNGRATRLRVTCDLRYPQPARSYGSKIAQCVTIPAWIKEQDDYLIACLRGLFETDGSVYVDRGYPMAMFVNACEPLALDVGAALTRLGFRPRTYRVERGRRRPIYHVRLSRDVAAFVALIRPGKS